jgi:ABC-type multidrug transport system fused ATPase/permease subunit
MKDSEPNISSQHRKESLSRLIEKLNSKKEYLQKCSKNYSNFRGLVFVIEVIAFFVFFFSVSNISALISLVTFFIFFGLITHFHNKLDRGIKKLELWIEIKTTHLARLNLDWENIPAANLRSKPEPNEVDLNLAGEESLHQLINTGTSQQSKLLLRNWLKGKVLTINKIIERQDLIRELIPMQRFRDKLTLHSMLFSRLEFNGDMLSRLLNRKEILPKSFFVIFVLLIILVPINIWLFVLYLESILPAYWSITLLIYIVLFHFGNKGKDKLLDEADYISVELKKICSVFDFLERYNIRAGSKLFGMCGPFKNAELRPSRLANKIRHIADMLRIRKGNPFVWGIIRIVFPADLYYKWILNKYEHLASGKLDSWLETWYNIEALSSLANFAYLNPEYTFPVIAETEGDQIIFSGNKVGHPLIKKENKVCNDFTFRPRGEIAIITGSNMSGKSTFIRILGINLSLAYAGCVVNAENLQISLFRLFTCIKVSDSLIDGISYFYAEVRRLKALLDEIESPGYPVFFLIDEIFRGTNNIERLKGSSMYIKKLTETNTVGVIATHDLELVKLSDKISKVVNYHFKEEIKNGKMIFDYKLNAGPCPTTNALKIMKLEGLPVDTGK